MGSDGLAGSVPGAASMSQVAAAFKLSEVCQTEIASAAAGDRPPVAASSAAVSRMEVSRLMSRAGGGWLWETVGSCSDRKRRCNAASSFQFTAVFLLPGEKCVRPGIERAKAKLKAKASKEAGARACRRPLA